MEVGKKDSDNDLANNLNGLSDDKDVNRICDDEEECDDDDEGKALLPKDEGKALLPKEGALSGKGDKPRRKVQWNDRNGDKLAEVLEFEPSEASDSDEEESESCLCRIM